MEQAERDRFEARLVSEREDILSSLDNVDEAAAISTDEDGDLTRYPRHIADQGTDTIGSETAMSLMSQASDRLALVDAALERLYREPESFGRCTNCGGEIPTERLELVPWAQHCLNCQSESEQPAEA
jgi:RNA polymerase-binding transcription factor DksA